MRNFKLRLFLFAFLLSFIAVPAGMYAVDIGHDCIDRASQTGASSESYIEGNTTASVAGTITGICVYWGTANGCTVKVMSLIRTPATNIFTARANSGNLTVNIGQNNFSAPGDFTAFAVQVGDYIGIATPATGKIEVTTSGGTSWWVPGDQSECVNKTFSTMVYQLSLSGTITEAGGGGGAQVIIIGN